MTGQFVKYGVIDVDIARIATTEIPEGFGGFAVCLWRDGKPVGFLICDNNDAPSLLAEIRSAIAALPPHPRPLTKASGQLPELCVAVCTHNRPRRLQRCLDGLLPQLKQGDVTRVLVIDNAPNDDESEAVARNAGVDYFREPVAGLNFARNAAVERCRSDWIAYVDDDVVVAPGWARAVRQAAADTEDVAAVTGQILPLALETPAQLAFERRGGFRREFEPSSFNRRDHRGVLFPVRAGRFGNGANMAFRRSLLIELGGFDNALDCGAPLPGGGDLDIFCRVIASGATLRYEPAAMVYHEHRRDWPGLKEQYAQSWGKAHMAYVQKLIRYGPYRGRALVYAAWWLAHELKQIGRALIGRHPVPATTLLRECLGGIA
ncbi:MAG: glycosyltransferase, partial [Woeseia sp.]|nr:glycosyltransferase [Woeseia sp.]